MAGPIRLGVAPIAWSNSDLPQLGGETTLATCLADSRAAGFSGTETGVKFPMDPEILGPVLAEHGLRLVSGWFSGRLLELSVAEEIARIEPQLKTFAALGAPVLVYAETTGSVQTHRDTPADGGRRLAPEEFKPFGDKLTQLAEHMAAAGVPMAYHHHMSTVIERDDDVARLMDATGDAVGLLADTGHSAFAGGDWMGMLRTYAPRINHVHCKDVRPDVLARVRERHLSFLDAVLEGVFTVPGDGFIDYDAVARQLAANDYKGWVVVEAEQDPAKAPPLEYARRGYEHLHAAFTHAGFEIEQ